MSMHGKFALILEGKKISKFICMSNYIIIYILGTAKTLTHSMLKTA